MGRFVRCRRSARESSFCRPGCRRAARAKSDLRDRRWPMGPPPAPRRADHQAKEQEQASCHRTILRSPPLTAQRTCRLWNDSPGCCSAIPRLLRIICSISAEITAGKRQCGRRALGAVKRQSCRAPAVPAVNESEAGKIAGPASAKCQWTVCETNAAAMQKITIASGGMRQRSSKRKPVRAIATSRPFATALTQIGL